MILIFIFIMGIALIIVGYQVAIKYNYKLIAGYKFKKDDARYPVEIEKKYLRHIGFPVIMLGIFYLILPFAYDYDWCKKATLILPLLMVTYVLIVPNLIVKKELKKLDEN